MDAMEAILTRRSIRAYTDEPVGADEVERLLEAAMAAPSAGNQQPWQFVVIDDRRTLDAIPKFHEYSAMLSRAPVAVAVCGDLRAAKMPEYWEQDCSAATENLLLAAHAMGLGAVWLGIHPEGDRVAKLSELLALPEGVVPLCVVALGRPAEAKGPADRYDAARVHRNRWG